MENCLMICCVFLPSECWLGYLKKASKIRVCIKSWDKSCKIYKNMFVWRYRWYLHMLTSVKADLICWLRLLFFLLILSLSALARVSCYLCYCCQRENVSFYFYLFSYFSFIFPPKSGLYMGTQLPFIVYSINFVYHVFVICLHHCI